MSFASSHDTQPRAAAGGDGAVWGRGADLRECDGGDCAAESAPGDGGACEAGLVVCGGHSGGRWCGGG